jgi:multiple sugar transport system permease protein
VLRLASHADCSKIEEETMSFLARAWPKSKLARREALAFYAFALPWLIGFLAFTLYPMLASTYYSFTTYNVVEMRWVGLANYQNLIADRKFYWSLWITAKYTLVSVPLNLIAALAVAVMLNQRVPFLSFWRTLYYLPSVITGVAVALLWKWILNPQYGILNYILLQVFGIQGPRWFWSEQWVIPAFWIMGLWGIGGAMVIYLAGLQGVPTTLYEAAEIDGANSWQRFRNITIPMISPVILFTLVTNLIFTLQMFTQVYVISDTGGPNNQSLMYVLYLFQNAFRWFRLGYASALAWVLFIIIIALTYLMLRASRRLVYYETPGG